MEARQSGLKVGMKTWKEFLKQAFTDAEIAKTKPCGLSLKNNITRL